MINYRLKAVIAGASIAIGVAHLSYAESHDLIINASGLKNDSGMAIAKLFVPGDNVRKHGRREIKSSIVAGKAQLIFSSIPEGEYAVVVFHDVNNNGDIDHNWIGLPAEGLGFSNSFKLGMFSGLPTFDKLRFNHGNQAQTIDIEVKE